MNRVIAQILLIIPIVWIGCRAPESSAQFDLLQAEQTGIDFSNRLKPTADLNMFKYMYFYNGAGVGAADFNQDGLIDLFFASNQEQDRLFLNQGKLKFKDITQAAAIPDDGGWSTGLSVVDINQDGLPDIYVCRVSGFESLKKGNLLLVNQGVENGIPVFKDEAEKYGLAFSGFSTQAAFFDYDLDGDLDCFLMNHSIHHNGTFGPRNRFLNTTHELSGDRFYRNDNGTYSNITSTAGIQSSVIGYGLGIVASDLDGDGWPDLYIGNDFHENDYLYINNRDGTFREELSSRMQHTSQFSMGVDAADVNNDGLSDIISADMLPADPEILKRSLGEDEYNLFMMKIGYGYHYQYTRNNLQKNASNGKFSELGWYAGIAATDWSWAPLWADFDNDGLKDLFISNGIPRRLNDIDYVNFVTNPGFQEKIRSADLKSEDMGLVEQFPQIKLPNAFFKNLGEFKFDEAGFTINGDLKSFSNGAVLADLDNDGDLDIVTNNIDDPVFIYRNNQKPADTARWLQLELKGPEKNIHAIGATVLVCSDSGLIKYEKYPVRGFQSSMEQYLHIGLGKLRPDSILLVWPDQTYSKLDTANLNSKKAVVYSSGLPRFDYTSHSLPSTQLLVSDVSEKHGVTQVHRENSFVEFNREALLPFMLSTEGPALAIADINGDGRQDFFLGSSKGKKSRVLVQGANGKFTELAEPALALDSLYEEVDAIWLDINQDGYPDLLTASGGNEYYGTDSKLLPRSYLNNGQGLLAAAPDAFPHILLTASVITASDFTGDGYPDLFIGARAIPFEYGTVPRSYLLVNDGNGHFTDKTDNLLPQQGLLGFVKDASWADLDSDGDQDLLIALEWGRPTALENDKGKFRLRELHEASGWWNLLSAVDINKDGLPDLIAGNQGYNNRLKPSYKEPVRMYVNDFDGNGKKEQLLTYYLKGKEQLFANKMELEKQLPYLKKKFLMAGDFSKAALEDIIEPGKLKDSKQWMVNDFSSGYLINKGNWKFEWHAFPWEAQVSPLKAIHVQDINQDGWPDLVAGYNFYANTIQMGRNDAGIASVLLNMQGNGFRFIPWNIPLTGEIRNLAAIKAGQQDLLLVVRNNDSLKLFELNGLHQK